MGHNLSLLPQSLHISPALIFRFSLSHFISLLCFITSFSSNPILSSAVAVPHQPYLPQVPPSPLISPPATHTPRDVEKEVSSVTQHRFYILWLQQQSCHSVGIDGVFFPAQSQGRLNNFLTALLQEKQQIPW